MVLTIVYQTKSSGVIHRWGSYAVSTLEQVTEEAKRLKENSVVSCVWIEDERGFPIQPASAEYTREGTV